MKKNNSVIVKLIAIFSVIILLTMLVAIYTFLSASNEKQSGSLQKNNADLLQQTTQEFRKSMIPLDAQNNSNQSGYAQIEELPGGKVKVKINLMGATSKAFQPAHIHEGKCPTPGKVKYPLSNVMSNLSETTLDVSIDALFSSGPLAINVHKSASESATYTSCGTIPELK